MRFIYEAIVTKDEDSYSLEVPDLPGCLTWGDTIEEVVRKAPDALESNVGSYIAAGEDVPVAVFGHEPAVGEMLVVVSFEATAASVGVPCIMAGTAAERLGVTPARVSHLIRAGILEGCRSGRETMVTVASVERYQAMPRKAGRPKRAAALP